MNELWRWLASGRRIRESRRPYAAATERAMALRILASRWGGPAGREGAAERVFELADFQEAAVRWAERVLAARGGVVVADSVGLGKTYVALALVEGELRRGGDVVVTTPAALKREWLGALRRLRRALGLRATYGIPGPEAQPEAHSDARPEAHPDARAARRAARAASPRSDACLAWLSHERLSRGTYAHGRLAAARLVVVDEAHAFRSPRTRRYRALAELCREARVVLLTATPVNNSLWDLYAQLRLFAGDDAFRDVGVPDLREAFRAAADGDGGPSPPSLLPVLREVMIRRTRPLLRERFRGIRIPASGATLAFPRRAPPVPVRYSLGDVPPGPDRIVAELERLTLAAFRPERYEAAAAATPSTGGAAELIRAGLLKRLESSLAAFRASLRRQARFHDAFLRALDRGRLLRPAEHRALYAADGDGDVVQLVLEELALHPPPPGLDSERLRADAAADHGRLLRLLDRLPPPRVGTDPKLERLEELLDREIRGSKVVIFTEYRDTARYLRRALAGRGRVALVDGAGAILGDSPATRHGVIERFAPRANRVRPPPDRERVDVLIATDVLAEGLNLQDADRVVSYDLPWNPVRLVQRIGRVDRLGSPHAVVHSYHFLPDRGLDRALRLLDRLRAKLTAIGRTVGHEAAVLDTTTAATGGFRGLVDRLAAGDPDALDAIERAEGAAFEPLERLRAAYEQAVGATGAPEQWPRPGDVTPAARPAGHAPEPADTAPAARAAGHLPGRRHPAPVARLAVAASRPRRILIAHRVGGHPLWSVVELPDDEAPATVLADPEPAAAEILLAALASGSGVDTRPGPSTTPPTTVTTHPTTTTRAVTSTTHPAPSTAHPATPNAPRRDDAIGRALDAVRPLVARRVAALAAGPPLPSTSVAGLAARRILAALAAVPGGPAPELCARADAILATLARAHNAGTDAAIRRAVTASGRGPDGVERARALVDSLERALEAARAVRASGSRDGEAAQGRDPGYETAFEPSVELVGIIDARPAGRAAPHRSRDSTPAPSRPGA